MRFDLLDPLWGNRADGLWNPRLEPAVRIAGEPGVTAEIYAKVTLQVALNIMDGWFELSGGVSEKPSLEADVRLGIGNTNENKCNGLNAQLLLVNNIFAHYTLGSSDDETEYELSKRELPIAGRCFEFDPDEDDDNPSPSSTNTSPSNPSSTSAPIENQFLANSGFDSGQFEPWQPSANGINAKLSFRPSVNNINGRTGYDLWAECGGSGSQDESAWMTSLMVGLTVGQRYRVTIVKIIFRMISFPIPEMRVEVGGQTIITAEPDQNISAVLNPVQFTESTGEFVATGTEEQIRLGFICSSPEFNFMSLRQFWIVDEVWVERI